MAFVDEYHDDVLPSVRGVDRLCGADGRHVAVALIGEHDVLRPEAAYGGGHRRCAAVGGFHPVNVDVVVGEYGAPYGRDADGLFCKTHFSNHLGEQLVDHAVAAARAIVHVYFFEKLRFAVNLVLRTDYILDFH